MRDLVATDPRFRALVRDRAWRELALVESVEPPPEASRRSPETAWKALWVAVARYRDGIMAATLNPDPEHIRAAQDLRRGLDGAVDALLVAVIGDEGVDRVQALRRSKATR